MDSDGQKANSFLNESPERNSRYYRTYELGFKIKHSRKKSDELSSFFQEPQLKKSVSLEVGLKPHSSHTATFGPEKQAVLTPEKRFSQTQTKFHYSKTDPKSCIGRNASQEEIYNPNTISDFSKRGPYLNTNPDDINLNTEYSAKISEIYLINKRKYLPRVHSYNLMSSSRGINNMNNKRDLLRIREGAKFVRDVKRRPQTSLIRIQKLKSIQELNKARELSPTDKATQTKVAILKKKIAISQMFGGDERIKYNRQTDLTTENRKNIYKSLLLEYHPDKSKHTKEVANEISNYLLTNKQLFVQGSVTTL